MPFMHGPLYGNEPLNRAWTPGIPMALLLLHQLHYWVLHMCDLV